MEHDKDMFWTAKAWVTSVAYETASRPHMSPLRTRKSYLIEYSCSGVNKTKS
jgi:hypothetical protein